jgi:hypothetical protein
MMSIRRFPKSGRRLLMLTALVVSLNGCRMFEKTKGGDGGSGNRHGNDTASGDPLFGGKLIPKQDIPIPGRNELADSRDPLLRATASNSRSEPFRLTPKDTTAALAGTPRDDVPQLNDRRSNEAGRGAVPFQAPGGAGAGSDRGPMTASIPTLDASYDTLRQWNAKFGQPTRDANGEYSFSAEIPGGDGPTRRFEGGGATPAAAVMQVVDQVRSMR